ncbi:MAG: hypothetical protein J6D28_05200 [Bacilli bacterium]|nr:hypothetical protein [Bacilli bacterium]MBP3920946.1 hypothetical protein [Bacilli bacterium]
MKCEIIRKTSKTGNIYYVLSVQLTETYSKDVFLDKSEVELLRALGYIK